MTNSLLWLDVAGVSSFAKVVHFTSVHFKEPLASMRHQSEGIDAMSLLDFPLFELNRLHRS